MDEARTKDCPVCGGDGECVTSHRWTCYDCQGTGKVTESEWKRLDEKERAVQNGYTTVLNSWEYRRMGG